MTFSNIKEKKGFTLVEILIVIMIIGILATSAVGGYTSYRRSALLSLSADDIVSQINDEVAHIFTVEPTPMPMGRYKITGINANPADTLVTMINFLQENR